MATPFPELPSGYPFPALERQVLTRWEAEAIFAKTLAKTSGRPPFVFYEGPPTANNKPHVGHVVTRVVKDLFPRFKTMQGFSVRRQAGWDTHGLPVEIEVEKQLGFSGKQDIERYGIEEFNRSCLESVHAYERQWREMTERVGFWIDLESAYFTYTNRYIESVWWALARLFDAGLLEKGHKIQPYCARCGTTLSSHEVAQNYQEAEDPSVWVRFPLLPGQTIATRDGKRWPVPEGAALVAWTTTPWSLLGHAGLAVNPELDYVAVRAPGAGGVLLFAAGLESEVPVVTGAGGASRRLDLREAPPLARFRGSELAGLRYSRPFATSASQPLPASQFVPPPGDDGGWVVFTAGYVTATEGTGVVHTAPAFGADDYDSGQRLGLPLLLTIDGEGRIAGDGTEPFTGLDFKAADREIVADLRRRDLLVHAERYRHSYPFCWRCDRPLLYYASVSWFVKTTARKHELVESNRTGITWRPEHVGSGRFGNWLENLVDWALSRKRYWGTPLPIWECDSCGESRAIGSFRELFARAGRPVPADLYDRAHFDPHRPFVDRQTSGAAFVWPCEGCGSGTMGRVDEVIDAWFDSGSMPFAQHHYMGEPLPDFDPTTGRGFPADFIAEAVDQTRGWFYTLHVLGVLLFEEVAYRNCIVLGHVNDESGRKMSKRLGNVVDPMEVIPETGADALRWYFCVSNPEVNSRFSARLVREAAQKFLLPLWNGLSFFTIYANIDGWEPGNRAAIRFAARPALDRWILLRLDQATDEVTTALESYRVVEAARPLEGFVDDLTNWYIRRSRGRFWSAVAADGGDKESAYQTLYEVLTRLARLMAPFTPFLADVLHRHLIVSRGGDALPSVHLEDWPRPAAEREDDELLAAMRTVQRIVRLGHAARNEHSVKIRQPLARVTVVAAEPALKALIDPYQDLILDELNVRSLDWATDRSAYVRHEVRPVYPRCGPRFGRRMKALERALAAADGDELAARLERDGRISLELDGETEVLAADELETRLVERSDTATEGDRDLLVALDTRLDEDLMAEGRAREIVHRIQTARKRLDLGYADRIRVRYAADPGLEAALATHREWIATETLAREIVAVDADATLTEAPVDDLAFALEIVKLD